MGAPRYTKRGTLREEPPNAPATAGLARHLTDLLCISPMVEDDVKTEIERLRAENDRLKRAATRGITLKVSEKGALSVYGLGRFPVTLYKEQWTKLLDIADDLRAFIRENEQQLKSKG
jgi:hypothetical protein